MPGAVNESRQTLRKELTMTKEQKVEPRLIKLGSARRQTKGTPIGAKQEMLVGYFD